MSVRKSFDVLGISALVLMGPPLFIAAGYLFAALKGASFLHWPVMSFEPLLGLVVGLFSRSRAGRVAVAGSVSTYVVLFTTDFVLSLMLGPGPVREQARALGDTRTVISAQRTFANFNGGYYADDLECLGRFTRCFPDLDAEAPELLDDSLRRLGARDGYERTFYPGLAAQAHADARRDDGGPLSPASVTSFAYVSVRTRPYKRARNFCGDSTGRVCFTENGAVPNVEQGRCSRDGCTFLEQN